LALFYLPEAREGATKLSQEESKHAVKVLRLKTGDNIKLIDGKGGWYEASIVEAAPKSCSFEVTKQWQEPERDFYIHITIAPTKNIDRIEWFVEKAVEIGVDEISFIACHNSERKVIKLERILKKAISAAKQSLKASIPSINELRKLNSAITQFNEQEKFIAYVDFENPQALHSIASKARSYNVLIGPEGDFSEEELHLALDHNYKKVSLGQSRLRTETAGIAACHLLNIINS